MSRVPRLLKELLAGEAAAPVEPSSVLSVSVHSQERHERRNLLPMAASGVGTKGAAGKDGKTKKYSCRYEPAFDDIVTIVSYVRWCARVFDLIYSGASLRLSVYV